MRLRCIIYFIYLFFITANLCFADNDNCFDSGKRVYEIVFSGNNEIEDEVLKRLSGFKTGEIITSRKISDSLERLVQYYKKAGFRGITIKPECEESSFSTRQILDFKINEGYRSVIKKILVIGNIPSDVKNLPQEMQKAFQDLPASDENFNRAQQTFLLALRKEGYLQASVDIKEVNYDEDSKDAIVYFTIDPREPFTFYFTGNTVFTPEELLEPLKLDTRRVPFSPGAVRTLVREIRKLYQRYGYYYAQVNYQVLSRSGERIEFSILINEGEEYRIRKIKFHGNKSIASRKIKQLIETQAMGLFLLSRWYPGFAVDETLEADKQAIVELYQTRGFPDTLVEYEIKNLGNGKLELIWKIKEAPLRKISSAKITWKSPLVSDEKFLLSIMPELTIGESIDLEVLQAERKRILTLLEDNGYPNASVDAGIKYETGEVNYLVDQGIKIQIGKIAVEGAERTKANIIADELTFASGTEWKKSEIDNSQKNLYSLGIFRAVRLEPNDGNLDAPVEDLKLSVEERDTALVRAAVSATTEDGLHIVSEVSERNILGRASSIVLAADGYIKTGNRVFDATTARALYIQPRILRLPVDGLFEGFGQTSVRLVDEFSYDRLGGIFKFRNHGVEKPKIELLYSPYEENVFDQDDLAIIGKHDDGSFFYSTLGGVVDYDLRDNLYNPRKGSRSLLRMEYAGEALGSDVEFIGFTMQESLFFELGKKLVLANNVRYRALRPVGQEEVVPITKRIFLGGRESLRGFKRNTVAPRANDGSLVGGDTSLELSLELKFDFTETFAGVLFFDAGQSTLISEGDFEGEDSDLLNLRFSPGIGGNYKTPIGPISIEIGFPVGPKQGESTYRFNIGIGSAF